MSSSNSLLFLSSSINPPCHSTIPQDRSRILCTLPTPSTSRRSFLIHAVPLIPILFSTLTSPDPAYSSTFETMEALSGKDYGKIRTQYPDFTSTSSGLQYKDIRLGSGDNTAEIGDRVVIDWSGYTIGYYGRIFEARNKAQGGAFTGEDKDFYRFIVGSGSVIDGLDEGIQGMKVGGVRQIIVPPEIGYLNPKNDPKHKMKGPNPSTFSGQRALDFVLGNQGMIDKTLLFNIELKRIDKNYK